MEELVPFNKLKLLFINPGASRTGAPLLFLDFLKWIKNNTEHEITTLYAVKGELENEFTKYGDAFYWNDFDEPSLLDKYYLFRLYKRFQKKIFKKQPISFQDKLLKKLQLKGYNLIYANTIVSCPIIIKLTQQINCPIILHVRELEIGIEQFLGVKEFHLCIPHISHFIADSESVKNNLIKNHKIQIENVTTVYEYINYDELIKKASQKNNLRKDKRKELNIPEDAFVVGSSGTTDWRKGPDVMLHVAYDLINRKKNRVYFVWVGGDNHEIEYQKLIYDCQKMGIDKYIRFIGAKNNPIDYFSVFDLFFLCSREEPVGIVAMEASSMDIPIMYFENAGGINEFTKDSGISIPYLDTIAASDAIIRLQNDSQLTKKLGGKLKHTLSEFDVAVASKKIIHLFNLNTIQK